MEIRINNISKTIDTIYGKRKILEDTTFCLHAREIIAICGASGQGKTTLLNIITGLIEPTNGEVFYNKTPIFDLKVKEREKYLQKEIGYIAQKRTLLPYLNIEENIKLVRSLKKEAINQEWFSYIVDMLKISKLLKQYPAEVSGGEYQRTMIARSLLQKPDIIVADEPTSNLDSKNREIIINLFQNVSKQGTGILVATHDSEVEKIANRQITLDV